MSNRIKGFAEAHTHHGGFERWVYEEIKSLKIASKIYGFTSYGDKDKTEELATGTVQATGIIIGKYMQVEVLTNTVGSFVGQKYYVIQSAKANGKNAYQLYTDAGNTGTGMYVSITEME